MQRPSAIAALAAAAASLGACAAGAPASAPPPALAAIDGSAAPLPEWFDAHVGRPRAVLLLSPT